MCMDNFQSGRAFRIGSKEQHLNELVKSRQRTVEQEKSETLRKQAERALKGQIVDLQKLSTEDVQSLVHELQVHQMELEMQNEELRRTQNELEESRNRYSNLYDFAPIGYFTFDKNGHIIEVNLTGANILGIERSFLIKKPFSLYIAFSSRDVFYLHLRKVFRTNTRQTCEIKLVDKNKNQFDARLESLAVKDNGGNFSQCRTAIIDVTELKKAEEKLQRAYDELVAANESLQVEIAGRKKAEQAEQDARVYAESIVETLRESLVVLDAQLRVVIANQTFYRTFKVTPEETLNRFIYDIGDRQWDIPELRKLLEEVLPKNTQFQDFEVDHEFQNIGRRTMLLNARRIYQKDGDKELILLAIEDITEKKRLESQLLRSQTVVGNVRNCRIIFMNQFHMVIIKGIINRD